MPIRKGADYIKGLQDGREVSHAGDISRRRAKHARTLAFDGCRS